MKKKIFVLMLSIISIMILSASSYAYLKAERASTKTPTITLSNFGVEILEDINSVTLSNLIPVTDNEGLQNEKVTYKIKNTETLDANYRVSLIDGSTKSTMKNQDVRYQLKKTSSITNETETLTIKNLSNDGLLDEGTIQANEVISYELIMWIDYDANPNNLTFNKVLYLQGMQASNLDTSGANYPELLDNMIPVYYEATSDTEGVWRKADSKNLNETYKWFDYNEYMWANAVTVKETGTKTREEYLSSSVGTEISMEDITTMWVWIPRYKYIVWAGNNETSEEQLIDIEFEHGISKTGTVSCTDNISSSGTSSSSETCTDTTNGSIINGKSTYTHPAFTFGDEELTGFWYAKFEMSTDQDSTCATNGSYTNCNITGQNIYIKPDQISLRFINVSNIFVNIRNMELYNNVHGFTQSSSATNSSSQTGEITGDNNNYDIHMQKNMEWGAVVYLAYSEYGKYGNSMYEGNSKRVYKNNYHSSANSVYTYKTGYSGYSYNASYSTTNTTLYNDLTNLGSGQGYKGAGASTTGTIYGVYDMNGGAYDYTMGNIVNTSGSFYSSNSGFNSTPLAKYYDKYSYRSDYTYNQDYVARGKLGDATKEMTNNFTSGGSASWEGSYRYMPNSSGSWFLRGGYAFYSDRFGLSHSVGNNGNAGDNGSSRSVISITRNFPWLSE